MDASKIFFDMIDEYCGPLLLAAGYRISPQGFIEDDKGNKIFYQNPKYVEGTHDPQNPQFTFPVVPIDERSYLNIKATPEMELFNPFQNYKHACIVLLKLKKVLIPCYVDEKKLEEVDEEDWNRAFDDYFQIYSRINDLGLHEVGVVDTQDPNNPKELMKFSSDDLTKAVWGLAVLIYNNFCATKPLKQFKNIDRSWNKTQKICDEWNKLRAQLLQQVKIEQENVLNPDMVDYTEGMDDKTVSILPFDVNKFVEPLDCSDKNDPVLQQYLTDMFPLSQLKPYIEPEEVEKKLEPEPDDQGVGLNVTPLNHTAVEELVQPDTSMPSFEEMQAISNESNIEDGEEPVLDISDVREVPEKIPEAEKEPSDILEGMAMQASVKEEEEIEKESRSNSVFTFTKKPIQQPQQMMNPMMGMGMMNPMMGGMMNPMGMMGGGFGMNPLPPTNLDDVNFSNHIDPFAPYR